MSVRTIFDTLTAAGLTREGALGLMGNMMAESGMRADIAQRGTTGLTDEEYTAAADGGRIDFARDAVGYGLCQWTFHTRKAALLAFAREEGVSVGDEEMQVRFCLKELREDFPEVLRTLCASHDVQECARTVCTRYERPAVENTGARCEFAREIGRELEEPEAAGEYFNLSIAVQQAVMKENGFYGGEIDGRYSPAFIRAYGEFGEGMRQVWEGKR